MPTISTTASGHLALLHLTDSALPTGAFSHSFGLETYMQRGIVTGPSDYVPWLHAFIRQAAYGDALMAKLGAEAARRDQSVEAAFTEVRQLDALAHSSLIPREVRTANRSMGKRMARIAGMSISGVEVLTRYVEAVEEDACVGCPALVYGVALGGLGFDVDTVVRSYLMQLATTINQNAIRSIPLGQDAGQRALVSAYGVIEETVAMIAALGILDVGASAPGLELAQIAHETRHSRMFMS